MQEFVYGVVSGIISGTGMGGGTLLIILLTIVIGLDQHVAQATNLIFFIMTSITAVYVNIKNKNIDLKLSITISICGIIGAVIGANLAIKTEVSILKKYFGFFLLIIAIYEIYSIIKDWKKEKIIERKIEK